MRLLKDKKNSNQAGFTLIELMIVIAIIGSLAAIAVPKFSASQESARTAKVQADLRIIESAVSLYMADIGTSPATISDLAVVKTVSSNNYGPYIAGVPIPPSGTIKISSNAVPITETYFIIQNAQGVVRAAVQNKDAPATYYYVEDIR